jgi:hypothetical protein
MSSFQWLGTILGVCMLVTAPKSLAAQVLDKTVLDSTVWISYEPIPSATGVARAQVRPPKSSPTTPAQPAVVGGTGFLLFERIASSRGRVYLVTNKHVLPPEGQQQDIKIRVVVRNRDGSDRVAMVTVPIVGSDGKYLDSVRVHHDPNTDVAAVNIAFAAFREKFRLLIDAIMTGRHLDVSMLLTSDKIQSSGIGMGSQVYIIGFPDALFDPRNISPILRRGIIATDPVEGFNFNESLRRSIAFPEHVNGFLIDANIYPGSSGSLVVLAPDYLAKNMGQDSKNADLHPSILGIVAGSIPILDAALHSYTRIGLGIVYSADSIRDVIDSFDQ